MTRDQPTAQKDLAERTQHQLRLIHRASQIRKPFRSEPSPMVLGDDVREYVKAVSDDARDGMANKLLHAGSQGI